MIEHIRETTVGDLDGVSVGMGNMVISKYDQPGGKQMTGLVCTLSVRGEKNHTVGQGSLINVGGSHWLVVSIQKVSGELGSVFLRRIQSGPQKQRVDRRDLDWSLATECPQCDEQAGWNGGIEKISNDLSLWMSCPYCGNEFVLVSGPDQASFRTKRPIFLPGRNA